MLLLVAIYLYLPDIPFVSKIIERFVHKSLYDYLNVNKIINMCQSGFRVGFSTASDMVKIYDQLLEYMNNGKLIGIVSSICVKHSTPLITLFSSVSYLAVV